MVGQFGRQLVESSLVRPLQDRPKRLDTIDMRHLLDVFPNGMRKSVCNGVDVVSEDLGQIDDELPVNGMDGRGPLGEIVSELVAGIR